MEGGRVVAGGGGQGVVLVVGGGGLGVRYPALAAVTQKQESRGTANSSRLAH